MQTLDFEKDLRIDPNALDVEWLMQPQIFMKYAEAAADTREEADRTKEMLDLVKAELDSEIRKNPEDFLGENTKVTNPAVDACILQQDKYKDASDKFYDAKRRHDMYTNAVKAFDQRKYALENLVRLMGMSYFSAPKDARDLSKEVSSYEEAQEAVDKVASEKVASRSRGRRK